MALATYIYSFCWDDLIIKIYIFFYNHFELICKGSVYDDKDLIKAGHIGESRKYT